MCLRHQQFVLVDDIVKACALQGLSHVDKEAAVPRRAPVGKDAIPVSRGEVGEPGEMERFRHAPPSDETAMPGIASSRPFLPRKKQAKWQTLRGVRLLPRPIIVTDRF